MPKRPAPLPPGQTTLTSKLVKRVHTLEDEEPTSSSTSPVNPEEVDQEDAFEATEGKIDDTEMNLAQSLIEAAGLAEPITLEAYNAFSEDDKANILKVPNKIAFNADPKVMTQEFGSSRYIIDVRSMYPIILGFDERLERYKPLTPSPKTACVNMSLPHGNKTVGLIRITTWLHLGRQPATNSYAFFKRSELNVDSIAAEALSWGTAEDAHRKQKSDQFKYVDYHLLQGEAEPIWLRNCSSISRPLDAAPIGVTDFGRIVRKRGNRLVISETPLKPPANEHYARVLIDGKQWQFHRLLYAAYHPNDPLPDLIRHIDDDPGNNTPQNLASGSYSQNSRDATRNGRRDATKRPPLACAVRIVNDDDYIAAFRSAGDAACWVADDLRSQNEDIPTNLASAICSCIKGTRKTVRKKYMFIKASLIAGDDEHAEVGGQTIDLFEPTVEQQQLIKRVKSKRERKMIRVRIVDIKGNVFGTFRSLHEAARQINAELEKRDIEPPKATVALLSHMMHYPQQTIKNIFRAEAV